jgi:hypothetical protein
MLPELLALSQVGLLAGLLLALATIFITNAILH